MSGVLLNTFIFSVSTVLNDKLSKTSFLCYLLLKRQKMTVDYKRTLLN